MKILKKYTFELSSLIVISAAYFISRIYNILHIPIFTDEAIYTRWAQIAYNDAAWRLISLTDGKQPSFVWAHMILLRFFEDPLLAGRLVSVFSGFFTLLGVFFVAKIVFKNSKVAVLSAFIYLIYPFALVYDRLALYESILAMFFIWALYFQILLVKKLRFDLALLLGFILGGGILTKSSGFLAIYLMPFLYFLLDYKKKLFKSSVLKLSTFLLASIIIANAMYLVLRLSPFFHIIAEKNSIFVYPVSEWLAFSLQIKIENFLSNLSGLFDWLRIYFSVPFMAGVIFSFFFKPFYREKILLFLWFFLPFLSLLVFGKTLYPRYLFFMSIPLIPLVSFGLFRMLELVKNKFASICIIVAFIFYPLYANYYIINDFKNAPVPTIDLSQLINGWPAGVGVRESIEFFETEAKAKEIVIATQGTFGLMPYAYEIYLDQNPNIEIRSYWPIEDTIPEDITKSTSEKDVYFVFYQPCPSCESSGQAPPSWPLEKLLEYEKGEENVSLSVYKVLSN